MMTLWLGRHGDAVDADASGSDFNRQLSDLGRFQVRQMAQWLMSREETPQLVLHSPLVRARQTAELIAAEIPGVVKMAEPLLAPGFSTAELLRRLNDSGVQRIVCIGHQPDIGRILEELTGGRMAVSPGTLAGIEFYGLAAKECGYLRWLADPTWFRG
jgi:phosphohistidine phosphatase